MSYRALFSIFALLIGALSVGCGDDTPTSAEMDSIQIRVRHMYYDMNAKPVPDKIYSFRLEEGDEFMSIRGADGEKMFKLIDVIDPLHAEIQFESQYLGAFIDCSDSHTVVVGLDEVLFSPNLSYPEVSEYYCVRVSIGGY